MKWWPVKIGDRSYDLSHLHPFTLEFVIPAKDGKPKQRYEIDVIFSMHCFTRGMREGEGGVAELRYSDNRETRLFDEQRYHYSQRLPETIRSIGQRRCFHTGHDNFFTVELVDADQRKVEYAVYFKVSRSSRKGYLNQYVQSAYLAPAIGAPQNWKCAPTWMRM